MRVYCVKDGLGFPVGQKDFTKPGLLETARVYRSDRITMLVADPRNLVFGAVIFLQRKSAQTCDRFTGDLVEVDCPNRWEVSADDRPCQICGEEMIDIVPRTNLGPRTRHPRSGSVYTKSDPPKVSETLESWSKSFGSYYLQQEVICVGSAARFSWIESDGKYTPGHKLYEANLDRFGALTVSVSGVDRLIR